jgi:hypothetical protein
MSESNNSPGPFAVKDCALVAIATGKKAQNLSELRDNLQTIAPGSIYYHFWGRLLRPRFDIPQYLNDFATWSHYSLHDDPLAERLAILDPTEFENLEMLRVELVEIIEQRLDEVEWPPWAKPDRQFHFIRSQIVVFDTQLVVENPEDLVDIVPRLSLGSIYYHFIDARRRTEESKDDFHAWLAGFGSTYADLCRRLASADPYFVALSDLRRYLAELLGDYFGRQPV